MIWASLMVDFILLFDRHITTNFKCTSYSVYKSIKIHWILSCADVHITF